jgi:16S rRNA (uracil1498-N3)-methyltransferase
MTAPLFVVERAALLGGDTVALDGAEGRHAAAALRLGPGEEVLLTDGAGLAATCRVLSVAAGSLLLAVEDRRESPPPQPRTVVVQALPKGDRGELAVELATELGVDLVVPWAAARCVTRWRPERAARSLDRWRTAARAAAKQSRREWFPEVAEPADTAAVCELLRTAALPVVLHEHATLPLGAAVTPAAGQVVVVVGPEGGLSPDELAAFAEAGATPYRLGPTVLRTSTAGAAALAVLLSRSPRWDAPTGP